MPRLSEACFWSILVFLAPAAVAQSGVPLILSVTNAASYSSGPISPGEMVVIFGTGIGPTQLVKLSLDNQGRIATSLAEVQILFDGVRSPLIYVSQTQVAEYLRDTLHLEHGEAGARLMIQQLRERNFVLCQAGAEYLSFVHRTFLEYFCASAFVRRFLATVSIEELQQVFQTHWREESWSEVLMLIAGMVPEVHAGKLIEGLLEQDNPERDFENVFLAAACWREVVESGRTGTARRKLWRDLLAAAEFMPAGVAYPVDHAGTESRLIWTLNIRTRAVTTIGVTFAGDSQALKWLKECLAHRKSWAMRQAAVRALAKGWRAQAETGAWLRWAGRPEEDENVRITAVRETARGWNKDPETFEWLRTLAESDKDVAVRNAAVQELKHSWSHDAETVDFLRSLVDPQ